MDAVTLGWSFVVLVLIVTWGVCINRLISITAAIVISIPISLVGVVALGNVAQQIAW